MKNILNNLSTITIAFTIVTGACSCNDDDDVKPNIEIKDDITLCAPACERAQELECIEGQPLVYPIACEKDNQCEDGVCIEGFCTETCVMFCEAIVLEGRHLGLECWQTIETCDDIEAVCR